MASTPASIELSDKTKAVITEWFFRLTYQLMAEICKRNTGITINDLRISKRALSDALAEAAKDYEILCGRRQNNLGINVSKLGGIVVFRLSRAAPIHLQGIKPLETPAALEINYLVAIAIGCKFFLKKNIADLSDNVTRELVYTLVRRHMNQETLGIVFDAVIAKSEYKSS